MEIISFLSRFLRTLLTFASGIFFLVNSSINFRIPPYTIGKFGVTKKVPPSKMLKPIHLIIISLNSLGLKSLSFFLLLFVFELVAIRILYHIGCGRRQY